MSQCIFPNTTYFLQSKNRKCVKKNQIVVIWKLKFKKTPLEKLGEAQNVVSMNVRSLNDNKISFFSCVGRFQFGNVEMKMKNIFTSFA